MLPHKNRFHFIKSTLTSLGRYFTTIFMIALFFRRFVFGSFFRSIFGSNICRMSMCALNASKRKRLQLARVCAEHIWRIIFN